MQAGFRRVCVNSERSLLASSCLSICPCVYPPRFRATPTKRILVKNWRKTEVKRADLSTFIFFDKKKQYFAFYFDRRHTVLFEF